MYFLASGSFCNYPDGKYTHTGVPDESGPPQGLLFALGTSGDGYVQVLVL